jgi:molecular chaperone DnaK
MAVTLEQYVQDLLASGLMEADELRDFRAALPPQGGPLTAESLGHELVRRGRLSHFQAARIYAGQPGGMTLGNYVIVDQIGAGGMGDVFKAEHRRMKRPVVIKVLHPKNTEAEVALKRFEREVIAAGQLSHPNIVTAFDAGAEAGVHYLVMEYVEGCDLSSLVKSQGPLTVDQALDYLVQAARGLAYAHAQGIVHRDVKPSNLLVDTAGTVKVLDLGLARLAWRRGQPPPADEEAVTEENQIVGTVDYMSPEQADNSGEVDERSDIYSLGCTLYRLLTGKPPYGGDSFVQKLVAHRRDPIPSLCAERRDVPESLDRVYQRMLGKRPRDRFPTMLAAIEAMSSCREQLQARRVAEPRLPDAPHGSWSELPAESTKILQAVEETQGSHAWKVPSPGGEPAVGIDLGTTYSVIACVDAEGRLQTLTNDEGDKATPSAVLFDGQDVIIGKEAIKAMATDMDSVAESAKRELGHRHFHKLLAGAEYPPEALQAWILNKIRGDAWKTLGRFRKVVITVPAYFDEVRRKATQDAGYMAGFDVLDIINEPTAAAIAFGYEQGRFTSPGSSDRQTILVYDLGGGTFDVSVLEVHDNRFVTLATDGDVQLGGRDWDQRLVDYVADFAIRQTGVDPRDQPNSFGRLLCHCEEAKRALSVRHKTHIVLDVHGSSVRVPIARDEFEEMTQDLLERTAFTAQKTVRAAGCTWPRIDRVLLVGGMTRMPAVVTMLTRLAGKPPDRTVSPDEAVAHGAALHAAMLLDRQRGHEPRFEIRNVNSHSLGVAAVDPRTKRRQTAVVIPRNTALPVTAKRIFTTSRPGQRSILVQIVEGESESPSDCVQIGRCTVRDLPPDLPTQTPVTIRFRYEENGRLTVRVRVGGTSTDLNHHIHRENMLGDQELKRWRQRISGLPDADVADDGTRTASRASPEPTGS